MGVRRDPNELGVLFNGIAASHTKVLYADWYRLKTAEEKNHAHYLLLHRGLVFVEPNPDLSGFGIELAGAVKVHLSNDVGTGWN